MQIAPIPTLNLLGHNSPSPWDARVRLRRALWLVVENTLFRFSLPSWYGWRNAWLRYFGATIVDQPDAPARVWPDARIYFPWNLTLASGCLVGPGCRIYNLAEVTLAEGANLSRHVHLCAGSHDYSKWSMPLITASITIERNVWIATEVFVGPGVTIGEQAVIGARSVVLQDQPAGMLCVGHPCKPKRPRPPLQ